VREEERERRALFGQEALWVQWLGQRSQLTPAESAVQVTDSAVKAVEQIGFQAF